jgi:hypothetical protein
MADGRLESGIGNDHVHLQVRHRRAQLAGQKLAHLDARVVYRDAVDQRIRARKVNELEHARRVDRMACTLAAVETTFRIDQDRLTRRHVAHQLEAHHIEGDALRGHQPFGALGRIVACR